LTAASDSPHLARGNAARARVRVAIEHVFAAQKCRLGLIVRSVGLARATARLESRQPGHQHDPPRLVRDPSRTGLKSWAAPTQARRDRTHRFSTDHQRRSTLTAILHSRSPTTRLLEVSNRLPVAGAHAIGFVKMRGVALLSRR